MKILIVVYSLAYGGAEKQVVVDANALREYGHQVTVAYFKHGELTKLLHQDITLYKLRSKNAGLAALQLFFHCVSHRYHVVHAHMFWAEKISAPGWLLGQRIIMNEHGLGVWRKWHHSLLMRIISRLAHLVVNSCDATKNNRVTIDRLKPKKLMTLYNSFETNNPNSEAKKRNNHPFTVGFVGRFDPVKRLEFYLPLAQLLKHSIPGVKFVLVGDGDKREELEKQVNEAGLQDYFHFPGYVLDPGRYLSHFDAFFMPSLREAFSIALLEAGAYEVPAVAFNVGGNPELIKDNETGFIVENNDIEAAAATIHWLYRNPEEKIRIGRDARRFVTETFSVKQRLQHLGRIYQS